MGSTKPGYARVASLAITRIFYAINWLNITSVFFLMAGDFNENVSGLGLISFAGFLGAAMFQVPGGLLSARIGPKKVVVTGTMIASVSALLIGISGFFYQIVALRFLVGLGLALVYAPGVTLVARYYREGSEGFAIGVFNSAYYFGGVVGIFGWIVVAKAITWRMSMILGGLLELATVALLLATLPKDDVETTGRVDLAVFRKILLTPKMLSLSFGVTSLQAGLSLTASFMVFYLTDHLGVGAEVSGVVASLYLVFSLIASPISGRMYDRLKSPKRILFASASLSALGVGLAALGSLYAAILSTVIVGFMTGIGSTAASSAARELESRNAEYRTLAVGWVNTAGLTAGFVSPLIFSFLVVNLGYSAGWLLAGVYAFLFALPVLLTRGLAK